jgi:hypothetical protein
MFGIAHQPMLVHAGEAAAPGVDDPDVDHRGWNEDHAPLAPAIDRQTHQPEPLEDASTVTRVLSTRSASGSTLTVGPAY